MDNRIPTKIASSPMNRELVRSGNEDKGKTHSKRAQLDDSVEVGPMEEQVEERPIGVKAAELAKSKGTKNVKRTSKDREAAMKNLQSVAALREKEFALKEKASANKDKLADKKLLANPR
ncbi:unnamed protein product [Microthlaspi erraticum]|uniref:Uncharacterized protein n=1 Tax=Microthlaspi erraticum TaxID=1685480 RepID=A0A6D2J0M9_9BRAS|nr:unnamed protein product [Microthlaspi erraticum]